MGFFSKRQVQDKPTAYLAGLVAARIGMAINKRQIGSDQDRFGRAIASILQIYSAAFGAPALLNMLAIGSGHEYVPSWEMEWVRAELAKKVEALETIKNAFVDYSKGLLTETDLSNTIVMFMGYPVDKRLPNDYVEGIFLITWEVLSDLGEIVKSDSNNGKYGQDANDAMQQGVIAAGFLSLLILCENASTEN